MCFRRLQRTLAFCMLYASYAACQNPQTIATTCSNCHLDEASRPSSMAIASSPATQSQLLIRRKVLDHVEGKYKQQIQTKADHVIYTVSDETHSVSTEIAWTIGSGIMGQAYLFRHGNEWYETQVTYYNAIDGLGRMLGGRPANDLSSAIGTRMSEDLVRSCFKCHATGSRSDKPLDPSKLIAGVQCVLCHSGAAEHINGMGQGQQIFPEERLSNLSTEAISNLCGGCHRTWSDIVINGPRGPDNVRFQPYRLANSKCYRTLDQRISCVACHDPHHPVETSSAFYDSKCKSCHSARATPAGNRATRICRVGRENCISCHMPKYTLPNTKEAFTDHWIRVAHANESYPN